MVSIGEGMTLHQRFLLVERIGAGGVASVWHALDQAAGERPVALKVLHDHLRADSMVVERFRREADIARDLEHPAIVRGFELFEDDGALSFALELLTGRTLKEAILADGPLPIDEATRIFKACLEGLHAAHQHGVIHRDVKPHNVFVCDSGVVKLLDFGFARVAATAGLTSRSVLMCTPDYAAPEIVLHRPIDGRADYYALGVMAYEMLTGKLPFDGATPLDLLQQHVNAAPPSPTQHRQDIPEPVERLVMRLLEKRPEDRPATRDEILWALDGTATNLPATTGRSCATCGESHGADVPLCPACGASTTSAPVGQWMVVLVRAQRDDAPAALRRVVESIGAVSGSRLTAEKRSVTKELPRVIVKGLAEGPARTLRDRCQAEDLQVELRQYSENNSDLLHRSTTPGYVFAAALMLPWLLALSIALWIYVDRAGITFLSPWVLLPMAVLVAGVGIAMVVFRHAHVLLPALARFQRTIAAVSIPDAFLTSYRATAKRVTEPPLRSSIRRLLERVATIDRATHRASGPAQALLLDTNEAVVDTAELGLRLASDAQETIDHLKRAEEATIMRDLESLSSQIRAHPERTGELQALIDAKEETLARIGKLEQRYARTSHQLLEVVTALDRATAALLLSAAPSAASVSSVVGRLRDQTDSATEALKDLEAALTEDPLAAAIEEAVEAKVED